MILRRLLITIHVAITLCLTCMLAVSSRSNNQVREYLSNQIESSRREISKLSDEKAVTAREVIALKEQIDKLKNQPAPTPPPTADDAAAIEKKPDPEPLTSLPLDEPGGNSIAAPPLPDINIDDLKQELIKQTSEAIGIAEYPPADKKVIAAIDRINEIKVTMAGKEIEWEKSGKPEHERDIERRKAASEIKEIADGIWSK